MHPRLYVPVEALLGPVAEQPEPPAHQRIGDGCRTRVTSDVEGHLAGTLILDHFVTEAPLLQVALQGLIAPAPHAFGAAVTVPRLVDHSSDADTEIKTQPAETAFEQHVAAEQFLIASVHRAQDRAIGELILTHQAARCLPGAARHWRAGRLAADDGGTGVDVPVPLRPAVLRGPRRIVVDLAVTQVV